MPKHKKMPSMKVAIVGGGFIGLGCIKALKEELIEPVCFEKCPEVGGTWCYRNNDSPYQTATVMSTTTLNQSKEMGSISNCPFPPHAPNHMRHDEVYKHFMDICEAFDIKRHVICNREVISVKRAANYDDTGRWDVTVRNTETQETTTETFDAVIMCTGNLGPPNMPSYPGIDKFKGRIMHSQELRTFESFMGENVVVVGTGCSALDAAVEISNVAKQVYWGVRSHTWILPRISLYGLPIDYLVLRRYIAFFQRLFPVTWASKVIEHVFLSTKFHQKLYGINPEYSLMCRDPVVNDHIPAKLMNGSISLRKNIKEIGEDYVMFEGETEQIKVDTLLMATGYKFGVPCLEEGILLQEEKGKILLYKGIVPPHLKHPTMFFIGYFLILGPGFPIGEMQTRWMAQVLSGKLPLPREEEMMKEIEDRYQSNVKRYSPSDRMSQRLDFEPYLDDLASDIGAMPNFWKMAFTDPRLFVACIFGPLVSYQYRLVGPHKWGGARQAILAVSERMKAPLKQAGVDVSDYDLKENFLLYKIVLAVQIVLLMFLPHMHAYLASNIAPALLILHIIFSRLLGGRILFYIFLPTSIFSWFWFPTLVPYLLIFQAIFAIVSN